MMGRNGRRSFFPFGEEIMRGVQLMTNEEDDRQTKAERREQKRQKGREMGMSGRSVRELQEVIRRKAERARRDEDTNS